MEFPRLVYKSAALHKGVNDPDEFEAAISDGWFASVPEALAPKKEAEPVKVQETQEPQENSAPTRAEMEQKASELGVKFDGRTSDAKLLKLINEAI